MLPKEADVVIIGGGVNGLSTAYHLAKRGCTDIIVLEKEEALATQTTGLSAGGIRQQFSTAVNILMAKYSVEVLEHFEEITGQDPSFRQVGYLFLLSQPENERLFRHSVDLQHQLGVPTEWLSPSETAARWPFLAVDDLLAATYHQRDGYADPYAVANGFAAAARRLGARIFLRTEVQNVVVRGGAVQGVVTNNGAISTAAVVNTSGPWAHDVAKMAGVDLPAHPYRRQIFITAPFDKIPRDAPMTIDFAYNWYFRPEGEGLLTGMSDLTEPSSFNMTVDWNFMVQVIEHGIRRAPAFADAQVIRGWAGLYCVTPDDQPIMGAMPGIDGFYCAVGYSGHGFMLSPATGLTLAECILDDRPITFDISEFSLKRFSGQTGVGEEHVI
jgi:sarcosine oxidase subunit beta